MCHDLRWAVRLCPKQETVRVGAKMTQALRSRPNHSWHEPQMFAHTFTLSITMYIHTTKRRRRTLRVLCTECTQYSGLRYFRFRGGTSPSSLVAPSILPTNATNVEYSTLGRAYVSGDSHDRHTRSQDVHETRLESTTRV
jgi:hypothetical protein